MSGLTRTAWGAVSLSAGIPQRNAMSAHAVEAPAAGDFTFPLAMSTDLRAGRITVTGELERTTAHHLLDVLDVLAISDQHTWTVDVAGITFCDVEGLRVLARARSLAESSGRVLRVTHPRPFLVALLLLWESGSSQDR